MYHKPPTRPGQRRPSAALDGAELVFRGCDVTPAKTLNTGDRERFPRMCTSIVVSSGEPFSHREREQSAERPSAFRKDSAQLERGLEVQDRVVGSFLSQQQVEAEMAVDLGS
jgi:hypothetical protein